MAAPSPSAEDAEGAGEAEVPVSGVNGHAYSSEAEGEDDGAAGDGPDVASKRTESVDGEDVFEVEQILDMKIEEGNVLYKVRWKGYSSEDDTWEPEIHLQDCKEVLLEFRNRLAEKSRSARNETQNEMTPSTSGPAQVSLTPQSLSSLASPGPCADSTAGIAENHQPGSQTSCVPRGRPPPPSKEELSLNSDIFETNSDSDQQSETKEDTSPKKKKKKLRNREERSPDEVKKKRAKTGKLKDKPKPGLESPCKGPDARTKKRNLEAKEELKESKRQKKDEMKETKELKKVKRCEIRESKTTGRDVSKENRKTRKEKCIDSHLDSESSVLNDSPSQDDNEDLLSDDNRDQRTKSAKEKDIIQENIFEKQFEISLSTEEESDIRAKRKKTKPRKTEDPKESKKQENRNLFLEKKNILKKQRNQGRDSPDLDKVTPVSAQTQKSLRPGGEERILRSSDPGGEDKDTKKHESKEKFVQRRHDPDKEEKCRKDPKGLKAYKEIRNAFDLFKLTPEERTDFPENNRKREDMSLDCKVTEDHKPKETKPFLKERRNPREEVDTWMYIASEADQEAADRVCQAEENADGKQQILSLGMDLQLEWMKLEDFQKHLDGEDEHFPVTDTVTSNSLRDAVKNGEYIKVKIALNSNEDYNLDQEDSSGMTLVMLAAAGGQDDLLRLLIRKGAQVNGRQKNGTTALIHAAEKNFLTTVAILLEAGAFVNVQQSNGETALMKACKRGNSDIVRLVIECGADCNILSKHQNSALHFAKQCNNVLVYDLLKSHLETLSRVAEETIRDYFEARLVLLEPVFPIACHRLCEGPDFSTDFNYKPPQNIPEGSGILLFIFHANFLGREVIARLCGPCSVQAVVLNDKFQLPVFLDSHFVYSFSPVPGLNKLFLRLTEAPSAKVKLLIGAYRVQLQ